MDGSSRKDPNEINLMYQPLDHVDFHHGASLKSSELQSPAQNSSVIHLTAQSSKQRSHLLDSVQVLDVRRQQPVPAQQPMATIATSESTQTDNYLQQSIAMGMNDDIRHLQNRIRELENKINMEPTVFHAHSKVDTGPQRVNQLHLQRNSVTTESVSYADLPPPLASLTIRNDLCYEADGINTEDMDDDERSSIKFLSARRQSDVNHRGNKLAARRATTGASSITEGDIDPNPSGGQSQHYH